MMRIKFSKIDYTHKIEKKKTFFLIRCS